MYEQIRGDNMRKISIEKKKMKANKFSNKINELRNIKFRRSILGKMFTYYLILMILVLFISGIINSVFNINESKSQFLSSTKQFLKVKKENVDNITSSVTKTALQIMANNKITESIMIKSDDILEMSMTKKSSQIN